MEVVATSCSKPVGLQLIWFAHFEYASVLIVINLGINYFRGIADCAFDTGVYITH